MPETPQPTPLLYETQTFTAAKLQTLRSRNPSAQSPAVGEWIETDSTDSIEVSGLHPCLGIFFFIGKRVIAGHFANPAMVDPELWLLRKEEAAKNMTNTPNIAIPNEKEVEQLLGDHTSAGPQNYQKMLERVLEAAEEEEAGLDNVVVHIFGQNFFGWNDLKTVLRGILFQSKRQTGILKQLQELGIRSVNIKDHRHLGEVKVDDAYYEGAQRKITHLMDLF